MIRRARIGCGLLLGIVGFAWLAWSVSSQPWGVFGLAGALIAVLLLARLLAPLFVGAPDALARDSAARAGLNRDRYSRGTL